MPWLEVFPLPCTLLGELDAEVKADVARTGGADGPVEHVTTTPDLNCRAFRNGLVHQQPAPRRRGILQVAAVFVKLSIRSPHYLHEVSAQEADSRRPLIFRRAEEF